MVPLCAGDGEKTVRVWRRAGRAAVFAGSLVVFLFVGVSAAAELLRPFDEDFCLATDRPLEESTYVETSYSVVPPRVTCRYEYSNGSVEAMSAPAYGRAAAFASLSVVPLAAMVLSLRRAPVTP